MRLRLERRYYHGVAGNVHNNLCATVAVPPRFLLEKFTELYPELSKETTLLVERQSRLGARASTI